MAEHAAGGGPGACRPESHHPCRLDKHTSEELCSCHLILAILERMHITKAVAWLEEVRALRRFAPEICACMLTHHATRAQHVDYISTQALLFQHVGLNLYQQTKLIYTFRTRICDSD